MLLIDVELTSSVAHGPADVSRPAEPGRVNVQPKARVFEKWPGGFGAGLVVAVYRDQHIQVLVTLGAQAFEDRRKQILTAEDGNA